MAGSARSVSFHPEARADLLSATDWYLERSHTAASEFSAEIDHALVRIQEAPERYPETRYRRRRFVLLKFPFDLIYRIVGEHVEIIAVAHHSRRPGYWRAR
ncbi:MAG TPA: type II toxin-antitoxin system RelE/ParE family toxin [Rhodothermales bacterium]|nr:type II toxin-antitoxin system RelE/ParE family toxin [Rhodothermales bacterium]